MRVSLAVQIFSRSVAKGIAKMVENNFFENDDEKQEAQTSTIFLQNMNDLFDMLNAKSHTDENFLKRGISAENIHILHEFSHYLSSITSLGSTKVFWITGLQQTVNAIIQLFEWKSKINPNFRLFTRRINQDALENFFGLVRAKGGNNRNPTLLEFLRTVSKLMTSSLDIQFGESNCVREADSKLQQLDILQNNSLELDISTDTCEEVY